MREKKAFNERTKFRQNDSVKIKYFLVFEGSETEEIYFNAINSNRLTLELNPIIELVHIVRDFGEKGWSNPLKIVNRLIDNINEADSGIMSYDILLNRFMDYMVSTDIIKGGPQCRLYWNMLKQICESVMHKKLDDIVDNIDEAIKQIVDFLLNNSTIEYLADNISDIIKALSITYDSDIDHICLIVDRDKKSFIVNERINQYQCVIDICNKNNFDLFITNPCFEFWLLLHFDDVGSLDISKLLENPNVTAKKKYTEIELNKRFPFKKNKYDANSLVLKLSTAISNEKRYCEDLRLLEHAVGSNLGKLFDQIITANRTA